VRLPAVDANRVVEGMETLGHQGAMRRDHIITTTIETVGAKVLSVGFLLVKAVFVVVIPYTNGYLIIRNSVTIWEVVDLPLDF
jgi:hypothetical protein